MMKADKIKSILDKRYQGIKKHYNGLLEDFKLKEIHDFRVEFKKTRAFIRLINSEKPGRKLRMGKKLKDFYHITGHIRNLQLHEKRIGDLCQELDLKKPSTYLDLLKTEVKMEMEKARGAADQIRLDHGRKQNLQLVPDNLEPAAIDKFIIQKRDELIVLIALSYSYDETLHDIRKNLKDVIYDWNYISIPAATLLPAYFTQKKRTIKFVERLGDFHDYCISVSLLNPIYNQQIHTKERTETLIVLREKLTGAREKSKNKITALLQKIGGQHGLLN